MALVWNSIVVCAGSRTHDPANAERSLFVCPGDVIEPMVSAGYWYLQRAILT
jgi:hypothetical protein